LVIERSTLDLFMLVAPKAFGAIILASRAERTIHLFSHRLTLLAQNSHRFVGDLRCEIKRRAEADRALA
jgi:hypothetical protein